MEVHRACSSHRQPESVNHRSELNNSRNTNRFKPDASRHVPGEIDFDEFIFCRYRVDERVLLVLHEEQVRQPNRFAKLVTKCESLQVRLLLKSQARIVPVGAEVKVGSEVLRRGDSVM
jgi:hypothetical protein